MMYEELVRQLRIEHEESHRPLYNAAADAIEELCGPPYSASCVECGLSRKNYKPITNADRIRAMSDEELAEWLVWHANPEITCYYDEFEIGKYTHEYDDALSWLKSPAEEGEG